MTIDRNELFSAILKELPSTANTGASASGIDTAALARQWMRGTIHDELPRATLDALCRQIDVRKRVSAVYLADFKRCDPEIPAPPAVVAGVAAALLATAAQLSGTLADDGFALKCLNSALKALTVVDAVPYAPRLRAWALELLDAHTERTSR